MPKSTYERINYHGRLYCEDSYREELEKALLEADVQKAANTATIKAQAEEIARQHEVLKQSIPAAAPAITAPSTGS